jgi:hypothetical protein
MRLGKKVIFFVLVGFLFVWMFFFITDLIRSKNNETPIFSIYTQGYDDGGSKRYTGLFYSVYDLHYENPEMTEDWFEENGVIKDEFKDREYVCDMKITAWFVSIDKVKDE